MIKDVLRWMFVLLISAFLNIDIVAQNTSAFDSLTKKLIDSKEPNERIETLLALSEEVIGTDPQQGAKYAEEATNIANLQNYKKAAIQSLIQKGRCYIRTSDYSKAIESAEKALELAEDQKMGNEIARAKGVLSVIFFEIGDFGRSAKYDFENLKYFEQINDQAQIGLVLGNIGTDFINQNNYNKGMEFLKKSLDIAIKYGDYEGIAYQNNNIASVYFEYYQDYKTALNYYKEALRVNNRLDDKQQRGIYLMNIGISFSKLNQNDSTLEYYIESNDIFRYLKNQFLYSECQSHLGEYYFSLRDINTSLLHADTALKISQANNFFENMKSSAGLLHKIYLSIKDTINAYKYAIIEDYAEDSLFVQQNNKDVFKLEFQYNYEKLDKERQIARQKKDNMMTLAILTLISSLIIILLIFSRHRIKAKKVALEKQSIEKELDFKNKELTINLMSLMKKNEMLADISTNLIEIEKGAKTAETKMALSVISKKIRHSSDDKILKEFSTRFQEVHSGFYGALLQKYPDLTQNELKLCAFLRLNMSSKDISELTGQSIFALENARYRLRKKLGISNSNINLVTFLSQI
jgi:tetratricopeptide (TPR) repeat protein/DNA-binding CsgD family transcriptional regulator